MSEARGPEHRLAWRGGKLEAGFAASTVIGQARQLTAGRLDAEEIVQGPGRQEWRAVRVSDARRVGASQGLGGADAVLPWDFGGLDVRCVEGDEAVLDREAECPTHGCTPCNDGVLAAEASSFTGGLGVLVRKRRLH